MIWTLTQAQALIAEMHEAVRQLDYHLVLGGGVLHTGASGHDLDLYFLPLNGYERRPEEIYGYIHDLFGPLRALRDGPDYQAGDPWHCREAYQGKYLGKRVDLFIW